MDEVNNNKIQNPSQFRASRAKQIKEIYADDVSARRRYDQSISYQSGEYKTAAEVREALLQGIQNKAPLVETSRRLYAINPIYSSVINYLSSMYLWRYKVTPHKIYNKSKAKLKKKTKPDDFAIIYNLMLEIVDGLSIETKFPTLLTQLIINGSVFFTTYSDEDSLSIDTLLLDHRYCRKVGESQYGTAIVEFDLSYFDNMGLGADKIKEYLKSFPKEFTSAYNRYKKDTNKRWQVLDPRFSSGLMINELGIPTYLYLYGGILDYEQYQDIELERNENLLKYIVVHTMPHYEDKLIFEMDEVKAVHQSIRRIVETNDKARLVTTYGDMKVEKISENDTSENRVLTNAFESIFNNAGFNSGIFSSETVEGLKMSLVRDKGMMWKYVQELVSFYNIAINNWYDFRDYQADLDILSISPYTYNDDIEAYRENATLGVGKLDYIIASGIKQKNIQDQLDLEQFLGLNEITPMQTSYTQTAKDRASDDVDNGNNNQTTKSTSEIEPSDEDKVESGKDVSAIKTNSNQEEVKDEKASN